jgi:hypothetical protein
MSLMYSRFIALNTSLVPSGESVGQRMSRARTVGPSSTRTGVYTRGAISAWTFAVNGIGVAAPDSKSMRCSLPATGTTSDLPSGMKS